MNIDVKAWEKDQLFFLFRYVGAVTLLSHHYVNVWKGNRSTWYERGTKKHPESPDRNPTYDLPNTGRWRYIHRATRLHGEYHHLIEFISDWPPAYCKHQHCRSEFQARQWTAKGESINRSRGRNRKKTYNGSEWTYTHVWKAGSGICFSRTKKNIQAGGQSVPFHSEISVIFIILEAGTPVFCSPSSLKI